MNVDDVKSEEVPEGEDRLTLIFKRQNELKEKYHHIEESQGVGYGLLLGHKFNINEIKSQMLLKDLAWRVVEEIAEATECDIRYFETHFHEELADALHFITELCLVVGIGPASIAKDIMQEDEDYWGSLFYTPNEELSRNPYNTVQHLGSAMNCLKQKPWKQTHILTDTEKFEQHIIDAYRSFCKYLSCFLTAEEMLDYYFRKSKVNDFRIKTKY